MKKTMTLEGFIGFRKNQINQKAVNKVESDYARGRRPLQKGEIKKFRASEEYKEKIGEALSQEESWACFFVPDPSGNPLVLKQYGEYKKEEEENALREQRMAEQKKIEDALRVKMRSILTEDFIRSKFDEYKQEMLDGIRDRVEEYFSMEGLSYIRDRWDSRWGRSFSEDETLTSENLDDFLEQIQEDTDEFLFNVVLNTEFPYESNYISVFLLEHDDEIKALMEECRGTYIFEDTYYDTVYNAEITDLSDHFGKLLANDEYILGLLEKSPYYSGIVRERRAMLERKKALEGNVLRCIPESYPDLYPYARKLHRKFVLHIGPTNSGKTYAAVQALKEAGSGIYLGPLRLLAFEQYEKMNAEGCPCSLVTGEERADTEGAKIQASTVEMADPYTHYRCAVIDEAQMLCDNERGGAWTAAILGLAADEIHVCASPDAEEILKRMVTDCGDEYEVVRHERSVPLTVEDEQFSFPASVRKGDALIVFSRKNVHAVASELQEAGFKASIIYGSLPYDVRQDEARKFLEGETDVVVSTDAIGMGMNLPARRVVFLETSKFDGKEKRRLLQDEVKQIAGRAGRMGMHEAGFVNVLGEGKKTVRKALEEKSIDIWHAVIDPPQSLIGMDGTLSEIYEAWENAQMDGILRKGDISRIRRLCGILERKTDDKEAVFFLSGIPFDEKNSTLYRVWEKICDMELSGGAPDQGFIEDVRNMAGSDRSLGGLETMYKVLDLLYRYVSHRGAAALEALVTQEKANVSRKIMSELSHSRLERRRCRECGKALPWNYPYGLCHECHDALYGYRNNYYGGWDDDDDDDGLY